MHLLYNVALLWRGISPQTHGTDLRRSKFIQHNNILFIIPKVLHAITLPLICRAAGWRMEGTSRLATMTLATTDGFLHGLRFCIRFFTEEHFEQCCSIVGSCNSLGRRSILGAKPRASRFQRLRLCTPIDFKVVAEMHVLHNISIIMGNAISTNTWNQFAAKRNALKALSFGFDNPHRRVNRWTKRWSLYW